MSPPPVLLLHGFATSSARTWGDNGWLDLLADAGRTVVAPDLLGHGDAAKPHDPQAYAHLEDEALTAVDTVAGAGPVDAVGFSLGARTLLVLAGRHPGRFRRIVVAGVGANLFRSDGSSAVLADAIASPTAPDDPALGYFHRQAHGHGNDPQALAALLRRPAPPVDDATLAAITAPVLVALGDRDFTGPTDPLVERLTGTDVRTVTLRGTDHFATPKSMAFLDAALVHLEAS